MEKLTVHLVGSTPLLCNSPSLMLAKSQGQVTTRKSIPTPEEEAEAGTYRNDDGHLVFPTAAFRKCAITGARGRKVGRVGLGTILMGALFPADEYTDLVDPETGKPLVSYEIDIRRAVPPKQGAVSRARPRMWPWACAVHFEYDEDIADGESIAEVLRMGGRSVGVGNYRPEKGGPFGRFTILRWE